METVTFRSPRLVALTLLVLIAGWLSALLAIGRQEDPTITNLFATVTTVFPSADPARVEALVSTVIADQVTEIAEVDVIESTSAPGISIVSLELQETLAPDRIEQVWTDVRKAVDDAARTFPAGVLELEFSSDGAGTYAAIIALEMSRDGVSESLSARYANALSDELRAVPGTQIVDAFGANDEEVLVTVDPNAAAALGLTADAISAAISAADAKVQAGQLRGPTADIVLQVAGEITTLDRIRQVVLRESDAGRVVHLGDIAEVTRGPEAPAAERALSDGRGPRSL